MTYCFVQTLEQEPRLTYGRLMMIMRKRIDAARGQVGLNSSAPNSSQVLPHKFILLHLQA